MLHQEKLILRDNKDNLRIMPLTNVQSVTYCSSRGKFQCKRARITSVS